MVAVLFIIIAFAIRRRFVAEGAKWYDKAFYYGLSVVFTPLFGPWIYRILYGSEPCADSEHRSGIFPPVC